MEQYSKDPINEIKKLREAVLENEFPGFLEDVRILSIIKKDFENGKLSE